MKITICCVGKIKEKYLANAIEEYQKRLGKFSKIEIIEVRDEKTPDKASEKQNLLIRDVEGKRLLEQINENSYIIALAIQGKMQSSEEFAYLFSQQMVKGIAHFTFVIGGSLGLSDDVLKKAQLQLSFSPMTFPHQLMRVILVEQIYRAMKINHGEPYHK